MSLNFALLSGNLTRDAESRMTKGGKRLVTFSLAVTDGYGDEQRTYFIDCVKWCSSEKQAEFFASLAKGEKVVITGKHTKTSYEKDGRKVWRDEVSVFDIERMPGGERKQRQTAPAQTPVAAMPPQPQAQPELYEEEIPF